MIGNFSLLYERSETAVTTLQSKGPGIHSLQKSYWPSLIAVQIPCKGVECISTRAPGKRCTAGSKEITSLVSVPHGLGVLRRSEASILNELARWWRTLAPQRRKHLIDGESRAATVRAGSRARARVRHHWRLLPWGLLRRLDSGTYNSPRLVSRAAEPSSLYSK